MKTVYVHVDVIINYEDECEWYHPEPFVGDVEVFTNLSAVKLFAREQVEKMYTSDHPGRDEAFYEHKVNSWIDENIIETELKD